MAITICNYGKTRTAKTSQFKFIAEHVWRKYKKKSRFVTTDTGSLWEPIQSMVDAEIVDPLFVPTDPSYNPLSLLRKLRRGAWPVGYDRSGFCIKPGGKNQWLEWSQQKDSAEVGAYGFESLSTMGAGTMRDLAEKNITVGTASVPGYRTEDGETFGQNTENHYGMILNEVPAFLSSLATLPVELVYVTAWDEVIEPRDKDIQKVYKLGPLLPGRKLVDIVPGSVNILIHATMATENGKNELRYYVKPHAWEVLAKYNWPAGLRMEASDSILAEVDKKWPNGYFVPARDKGIGEILEFRDEMRAKAKAEALKSLGIQSQEKGGE